VVIVENLGFISAAHAGFVEVITGIHVQTFVFNTTVGGFNETVTEVAGSPAASLCNLRFLVHPLRVERIGRYGK
jgi:hypothetical protein